MSLPLLIGKGAMRFLNWFIHPRSPTLLALVALVIGLAGGIGVSASGSSFFAILAASIEPLGALWVNAIRMTLIPLVVSLLITSVASFSDVRALGRLGARTLALFVALLAAVAVFSALTAPPLLGRMSIDPSASSALRAHAAGGTSAAELPSLRGFVVGLVPTNPLRAAVDSAMLPLIVFTLFFSLATTCLPNDLRIQITGLCRAISQAMLTIVRWILKFTPLGVFALAVDMGATLGLGAVGAVGYYIFVLCGLVLVASLALYPVVAIAGRISISKFAQACAPAQAVAIGTRSSLASLPALIEGARRVFGERPGITGLVLPLAVSTFKLNTPIADLVGPLFLAHLYGIDLTAMQVVTMTAVTIAMSFSNPGIPSGGLFVVTAPVMLSVGLPLEGIGILIAADAIPDIFNTFINVTGDMAVAALLVPVLPIERKSDIPFGHGGSGPACPP